jgi:hypothetical protein
LKVKVNLKVGEHEAAEGVIDIDDQKLEELTEGEIEGLIEVYIRNWANDLIQIAWEVAE